MQLDTVTYNNLEEVIFQNADTILASIDASSNTIKTYQSNIDVFLDFIKNEGVHLNTFRDFKKHLIGIVNLSASTKKSKFQAAKKLLIELHTHYNILPRDITKGVKAPRVISGHKKDGLNKEEVDKVRDYILAKEEGFNKDRLYALFTLLTYQGLRQFEVVSIEFKDLFLNDNIVMVKGKGKDDKEMIDLHPKTCQALKAYVKSSPQKDGFVFYSLAPKYKDKNQPLSTRGLRTILKDNIFNKLGIEKTLHGTRHFFVTNLSEVFKGDYNRVKLYSRHSSIQSIVFYDDRRNKKGTLKSFYKAF